MVDRVKTVILANSDETKSQIEIDKDIELPLIELFITKYSFVVFTTKSIYSRSNEVIEKIAYDDILEIDEMSISQFGRYKHIPFFCLELILNNGKKKLIMIENHLHPWRTIVCFLSDFINSNLSEDKK
ncbi:MAG: hypothetical protein ACI85O_002709 [Saprospiraceae bacterium]|jgi:hypothetical protein